MRLGIDFGTTRIVAAACDRGNYPVAAFDCPDGASREWVPPVVAVRGGERLYGWDAWAAQGEPGVTVVRSLKRVLGDAGPETPIDLGAARVPAALLLEELFAWLRQAIVERSTLRLTSSEPLEVLLGVPANANSNQRYLTVEGFRSAGFSVLGLLNEPSAASVEYARRLGESTGSGTERILVYDLGGGTFDASLVERSAEGHNVLGTEGIGTLGGDDFDHILAELALESAGLASERSCLTTAEEFLLVEECREKKESLHPNTRRLIIDLERVREGWPQIGIAAADYYQHCAPLVEETLAATTELLERLPGDQTVTLYVTGGASELPLVGRLLRERFGRRVRRSAYTRSATAIGLAIQAGAQAACRLRERFTRHFGVWREADAGRRMVFDPLFERGVELPAEGLPPLERVRRYAPVHNIGHFRYLECSQRGPDGQPTGDIAAWDEIRFPFDAALSSVPDLSSVPVGHSIEAGGQMIEERYTAEPTGAVRVEISNLTSGYSRQYRLGRWAAPVEPLRPDRARHSRGVRRARRSAS
jgi:molecular chaperone DnaK (HSP70)